MSSKHDVPDNHPMYIPPGIVKPRALNGRVLIKVRVEYLNLSVSQVGVGVELWGYTPDIIFLEHSLVEGSYTKELNVWTSLDKLTQYFYDSNVMVIVATDRRTDCILGSAYVELRTFIINNQISSFKDAQADILSNKKIIGSVQVQIDID